MVWLVAGVGFEPTTFSLWAWRPYFAARPVDLIHQTHRDEGCSERASVEIPLYVDYPAKDDFGINNTLTYDEICSIGSKNKLTFPLKMGEIEGQSGIKRPGKFKLSKIWK